MNGFDPIEPAYTQLERLLQEEIALAQEGSPFADQARWTADDAAVQELIREHLRTCEDPQGQMRWLQKTMAMELDERLNLEDFEYLYDREYTEDEVVEIVQAFLDQMPDRQDARNMVYETVLLERAGAGDDGRLPLTADLELAIHEQYESCVTIMAKQKHAAQVN